MNRVTVAVPDGVIARVHEGISALDGVTGQYEPRSEKAVLFEDSAVVRSLMSIAHRIHSLEHGLSRTGDDDDRHDQLESRLREKQAAFRKREEMVGFRDEWIPKSQIQLAFQRKG